jgi:hypothetical protein
VVLTGPSSRPPPRRRRYSSRPAPWSRRSVLAGALRRAVGALALRQSGWTDHRETERAHQAEAASTPVLRELRPGKGRGTRNPRRCSPARPRPRPREALVGASSAAPDARGRALLPLPLPARRRVAAVITRWCPPPVAGVPSPSPSSGSTSNPRASTRPPANAGHRDAHEHGGPDPQVLARRWPGVRPGHHRSRQPGCL